MKNIDVKNLTPMLKQYIETKKDYEDAILFFRLGDFYEMFFDDALLASKELDLTLTKRAAGAMNSAPMCGVPYHVAPQYISRLVEKGYKVAICDQLEDPKFAEGIVKRGVTRVVTPGTFTDTDFLENSKNNYLASIVAKDNFYEITYIDYTTGELFFTEEVFINKDELLESLYQEISKISPTEVIVNEDIIDKLSYFSFYKNIAEEILNYDISAFADKLNPNLVDNLNKNNLTDKSSLYNLIEYLIRTQKRSLTHVSEVIVYKASSSMQLDDNAFKSLEIFENLSNNRKSGSLLGTIDYCSNPMGKRTLRKFLEEPLQDKNEIERRLDYVEIMSTDLIFKDEVKKVLKDIYDIERLSTKIAENTLNPRDLVNLKTTIGKAEELRLLLRKLDKDVLDDLSNFPDLSSIEKLIDASIVDEPSLNPEDRFVKEGYSEEFDLVYEQANHGENFIINLEIEEKERTGIPKLRIKYNKILGYFIEVTKSYIDKVPEDYIRKQTLVGSERYFTLKLKEMESKILSAKNEVVYKQREILNYINEEVQKEIINVQKLSKYIGTIDALTSLGEAAYIHGYVRPIISNNGVVNIKNGRHPSVESMMKEEFIPNDVYLSKEQLIKIITGPNMAGKSTYMRMVAVTVIMAHIGSFIPADYGEISIVDKVFTRIGASDNLTKGESTFMVEMKEVAKIIDNATEESLIILDEVGRGTSTTDGLAIAWALTEYIAKHSKTKTLFATHYHELAAISEEIKEVSNLHLTAKDIDGKLVFLRKVMEGYSDNSYGIDVAKLAGVSEELTSRAFAILKEIDNKDVKIAPPKASVVQENIFDNVKFSFIDDIKNLNINEITPIMALNILDKIIEKANKL